MKDKTLHKQYNPNLVNYIQLAKHKCKKILEGILSSCNYIYCDTSLRISRQIARLE